jgi:serine protease Do
MAVVLGAGVAAGLLVGRALEDRTQAAAAAPEPAAAAPLRQAVPESFASAAEIAMKSVVHITTQAGAPSDLFGSQEAIGSGVIVSQDGHVLTNNHVAAGARTLRVKFVDGKEFAATVVGADSESDLALLRIDPKGAKLTPISFADSDAVRVGDWCLAIGSPFGYNHTVTAGIVSAKHRRMESGLPYQDFIQTDAAINPGNSGGALVDTQGRLIGINTAIITESRGNDGIGLAISANLVRWVKDRLVKDGKVRRGFLGIVPMDFNEQLVAALSNDGIKSVQDVLEEVRLKEPKGVFVFEVPADGPAGKAGLRRGDVLVELNGRAIQGKSDMFFRVAEVAPGTKVDVKVLREGKEKTFTLEIAERTPQEPARRPRKR